MNPDDYITGTHDPLNPINQEENEPLSELTELEEMQLDIDCLKHQLKRENERLAYKIQQLKRLAGFEECIRTFGSLTYEQQTEKNEILNQYLK